MGFMGRMGMMEFGSFMIHIISINPMKPLQQHARAVCQTALPNSLCQIENPAYGKLADWDESARLAERAGHRTARSADFLRCLEQHVVTFPLRQKSPQSA